MANRGEIREEYYSPPDNDGTKPAYTEFDFAPEVVHTPDVERDYDPGPEEETVAGPGPEEVTDDNALD